MSSVPRCVALSDSILCFYVNKTTQTQVARFTTDTRQECDRLIRPEEHVLFEAQPGSKIDIYVLKSCQVLEQALLLNSFSCQELAVSHELIETMLRWVE